MADSGLDADVQAVINLGYVVVVAAGNDMSDASLFSPARVASALTVGGLAGVAEARVELMKGNSGAAVSDKLSTLNIESSVDGFIQKVYVSPSQIVSANAPVNTCRLGRCIAGRK